LKNARETRLPLSYLKGGHQADDCHHYLQYLPKEHLAGFKGTLKPLGL